MKGTFLAQTSARSVRSTQRDHFPSFYLLCVGCEAPSATEGGEKSLSSKSPWICILRKCIHIQHCYNLFFSLRRNK